VPDYLMTEPQFDGGLAPQCDNPGENKPFGYGWVAMQRLMRPMECATDDPRHHQWYRWRLLAEPDQPCGHSLPDELQGCRRAVYDGAYAGCDLFRGRGRAIGGKAPGASYGGAIDCTDAVLADVARPAGDGHRNAQPIGRVTTFTMTDNP
jgi:hypothetical protein